MIRRLTDRIDVEIPARIRKANESSDCVIKDVSEGHMGLETSPDNTIALSPGVRLYIEFNTRTGEDIVLPCLVIRSKNISPQSKITVFSVKIEEQISEFEDFYRELFADNERVL